MNNSGESSLATIIGFILGLITYIVFREEILAAIARFVSWLLTR